MHWLRQRYRREGLATEVVHVIILHVFLQFCNETIRDSPVFLPECPRKAEKSVYGLPLVPHDLSWCYTDVVLYLELDYHASL